jgi:hypothetical protein
MQNHSVVQSTFDQPCIPIQNMMTNKTDAFFSGFMPTNASFTATSNILTYTIRVKDEKPMWFYCSQGKHCQAGMVGAVNAYVLSTLLSVMHTDRLSVPHQATRPCQPSWPSPPKQLRT